MKRNKYISLFVVALCTSMLISSCTPSQKSILEKAGAGDILAQVEDE